MLIDGCLMAAASGGRAAARRRKVIDAARLLFSDNGFHATGIAQIAKESGVAVGQLYRDFASKEEIVAAIVQTDCVDFMAGEPLKEAVGRGDRDSVRAWVRNFVDPGTRNNDGRMFAEILAESSRNERIAAIFTTVQADSRTNMLTALSLFAPSPEMCPRRSTLADTILAMSLGLMHYRLMHRDADICGLVTSLIAIVEREIDELERANAALNPATNAPAHAGAQSPKRCAP
jgi:AcrR family transcriptional regulator